MEGTAVIEGVCSDGSSCEGVIEGSGGGVICGCHAIWAEIIDGNSSEAVIGIFIVMTMATRTDPASR